MQLQRAGSSPLVQSTPVPGRQPELNTGLAASGPGLLAAERLGSGRPRVLSRPPGPALVEQVGNRHSPRIMSCAASPAANARAAGTGQESEGAVPARRRERDGGRLPAVQLSGQLVWRCRRATGRERADRRHGPRVRVVPNSKGAANTESRQVASALPKKPDELERKWRYCCRSIQVCRWQECAESCRLDSRRGAALLALFSHPIALRLAATSASDVGRVRCFGGRPWFAGLCRSGNGNATGRLWHSRRPGITFKFFSPEYSKCVSGCTQHRSVTGGGTQAGTV